MINWKFEKNHIVEGGGPENTRRGEVEQDFGRLQVSKHDPLTSIRETLSITETHQTRVTWERLTSKNPLFLHTPELDVYQGKVKEGKRTNQMWTLH